MNNNYDFLKNNSTLGGLSPEKMDFLMNFAGSQKPADMKDMLPFLMRTMGTAQKNNIQFSPTESDLLVQLLKQNMSPDESAKADKMIQFMKERRSGS